MPTFSTPEGNQIAIDFDGPTLSVARLLRDSYFASFLSQRRSASRRRISWQFEFDEWLSVWLESGHLSERGKLGHQYVMARFGDCGPYAKSNVRIITSAENLSEAHLTKRSNEKRLGSGRGWTMEKGRFRVRVRQQFIGNFATAEEAEDAHRKALAESEQGKSLCKPSRALLIEHEGVVLSITEWSRRTGLHYGRLQKRYRLGMRGAELFAVAHQRNLSPQDWVAIAGSAEPTRVLVARYNVDRSTIQRLRKGIPVSAQKNGSSA